MANRAMLYDIIYALAARDGREAALFGNCAPLAHWAFERSLAGEGFPELWFELPLTGEPWFDLHALVARDDLDPTTPFDPETCGGVPDVFEWFASQGDVVRQLALSWDVSAGDVNHPAVQLLLNHENMQATCDFLAAAERADAVPAYRAFVQRLPQNWFACYTGVFPGRTVPFLRVECIPSDSLQHAYAQDALLLEEHLRQVGLADLGDTAIPRCQAFARTPFKIEFQFDVDADGRAGATFSASLRFATPPGMDEWHSFDLDGAAGTLMQQIEDWGLSDGRWRLLADTIFAKNATRGGESALLFCYPAFVKLRWRNGEPIDAKVYLIAGLE